jgi:hypothetical protein
MGAVGLLWWWEMTLRNLAFVASALRQVRDVPRCTHEELSGLQEKRLRKLLHFAFRAGAFSVLSSAAGGT